MGVFWTLCESNYIALGKCIKRLSPAVSFFRTKCGSSHQMTAARGYAFHESFAWKRYEALVFIISVLTGQCHSVCLHHFHNRARGPT